jgi:hypothetical protein
MAENLCTVCGERREPHEAETNRRVAQAAQWPGIGPSVWRAIWPDSTKTNCQVCSEPLVFRASGEGADWVLSCPAGHVANQAEHKPGRAPAQWSWAKVEHYKKAVHDGLIVPDTDWQGMPASWHEAKHPWTGLCGRCEEVKGDNGIFQLTMPQVVRYCLDNSVPCTLVTDRGDATTVYVNAYLSLRHDFIITPKAVPVRTSPCVLNSLAAALRQLSLNGDQRHMICDIATRFWWRMPWGEPVRALYAPARALVRPVAYHCAWDHPNHVS